MDKDGVFMLRIDPETARRLMAMARVTDRSRSAMVRVLINEAWDNNNLRFANLPTSASPLPVETETSTLVSEQS